MKYIFFLSILLAAAGCTLHTTVKVKVDSLSIVQKIAKTPDATARHGDTLLITGKAAVSFWVDSTELHKRRKEWGDEAFYTGADDAAFYYHKADSVLTAYHLIPINGDDFRYLKFVQSNGAVTLIKKDTSAEILNIYLFNPAKAPYNADVTDMEDEYKRIFSP